MIIRACCLPPYRSPIQRAIISRERRSPIQPIGFTPPKQVFSEMGNGHLVAMN